MNVFAVWTRGRRRGNRGAAASLAAAAVLGLLVALPAAAAGRGKSAVDKKKPKKEKVIRKRVIGTILFPDRTGAVRKSSAKELLTPEVRAITARAMDYVRRTQQPDGSWGDRQFPKSSGVTALCCMSLFAEGSLPRIGKSGKKLDKGIAFLLKCAKGDGLIAAKDVYSYGPLYDHTWSTLVLLLAYGNIPWHKDARKKISRAIQVLLKAQKVEGGWRYSTTPMGSADISVTASVLTTLRFARISGFAVPEDRLKKAEAFVERLGKPVRPADRGTFCYRSGGQRGGASTTAAGLLALFSSGKYKHPYVRPCTENIAYVYSRYRIADLKELRYFYFGCFYSSQAMYMAGDKYWQPWYKKYASVLRATQGKNGEFRDSHGNRVYPTAIAAIVLQAPLGYLPEYLR